MKAYEARKNSIKPQYDSAIKEINRAVGWGWKSVPLTDLNGTLYPEVAKMLAKDGYDVKIVIGANSIFSTNEVSWENAAEGREGTITYVNKAEPNQPNASRTLTKLDELLKNVLGIEPEDDEEDSSDSAQ